MQASPIHQSQANNVCSKLTITAGPWPFAVENCSKFFKVLGNHRYDLVECIPKLSYYLNAEATADYIVVTLQAEWRVVK
jgi:hypothetical protein